MEKFSVLFLFITLINLTHQTPPSCTIFGQTTLLATELKSMARVVPKILAKYNIPLLGDYSDVPNSEEAMNEDLSNYEEGIYNQDARLTIAQLVEKYGYPFEQHNNVRTKDGYMITIHRIPNPGNDIVVLYHGILGSSIDWLMAGRDSLPFILASQGYDVWLVNFRGNRYSMTHESLTPDCAEFWDFSYEEFGYYDLPASIDYIRSYTSQQIQTLICYSVSTTAYFVMASVYPDYNDIPVIAISPMAWSTNIKSPILRVFADNEDLENVARSRLGPSEFKPSDSLTSSMRAVICANNPVSQVLCDQMPLLITGFNHNLLNMNNVYAISQHYPAGGSTKTIIHYLQNIYSGQFRGYDFLDVDKNIAKYDQMNPTDYLVGNIEAPVSFFVSENDFMSNVTDVQKLIDQLPNVGDVVYVNGYSAIDYLWAVDVKNLYEKILVVIEKFKS